MVLENGEICMKKIAAAAIAAIMSVSSAFCCPQTISEAAVPQIISIEDNTVQESGKCGNSAYWSLDGGKLSICLPIKYRGALTGAVSLPLI